MRCFALIQLDAEAAELLAGRTQAGEEPTWVHRCQLDHGHGGDHRCIDAATGCSLEWDDLATGPRIVSQQPHEQIASKTGRRPAAGLDPRPRSSDVLRIVNGADHPAAPEYTTAAPGRTEVQALDAIANALERMCDVFSALIVESDGAVARIGQRRAGSIDRIDGP